MATNDSDEHPRDASHWARESDPSAANHSVPANHATPPAAPGAPKASHIIPDDAVRELGDDADARLLAMRERVALDGARWRADLPPITGLAAQVSALSAARRAQVQAAGASSAQPQTPDNTKTLLPTMASNRREDRGMSDDATDRAGEPTRAHLTTATGTPRHRSALGAMRGVLAGVAAVVVVALLAGVLIALRNGHGASGPGAHPTATTAHAVTPTVTARQGWQPLPKLGVLTNPPVIAPSDPQVVYSVSMSGSIQRSANQGATWTTLPTPSVFPAQDNALWEDIFVSPLNANTVYAMANLTNTSGGPVNCPTPYNYALSGSQAIAGDAQASYARAGAGVAAKTQQGHTSALSGVVPCETQVVSADGGQHWRILTLPFVGRLGSDNASLSSAVTQPDFSYMPQAQGARLYSYADNGFSVSANGYRLATSTDGGVSWRAADGGLTANGLLICWYAATPTGATVYAVAASNCDPFVESPQSLWRSDDAGSSWRQVNLPPGVFTTNLAVAATPTPTLYLMAPASGAQPHTYNLNVTPNTIYVSVDGAQTWQALPTKGVRGNPTQQTDTSQTFVALPDGTLVAPFSDATTTSQQTPYYAWKPGAASWTPLPANVGAPIRLFTVSGDTTATPSATVWLLNSDLASGNASQAAYQVYNLTIAG